MAERHAVQPVPTVGQTHEMIELGTAAAAA
jgi:hypothetical protein